MNLYDLLRGLHILAVIAWMAGIMYLPRIFAYHAEAAPGSELDRTFQTMDWHHFLGAARKRFVAGTNTRSNRFWRATNELPFLAAVAMVLAVTLEFGR